ncbi:MAG: hypothetical protein ACK2UV_21170, partial [Candidatus Promineifilaceae bacterium]
ISSSGNYMKTTIKRFTTIFVLIMFPILFGGLLYADSVLPKGYLPIIVGGENGSGPIPTSTVPATPTSAANQSKEIPNGDFEDGRTVWSESSKWDNMLIVQDDDLPRGISPHNGRWAAWLGGDSSEEAAIEQRIFVDPGFPYLAYWYWIDWPFACQGSTAATAVLSLDQTVVWQSDVCEDTDSGGWVRKIIDIGAFAGQPADLRFQLTTKAGSFANLYLDDVVLQSSPQG